MLKNIHPVSGAPVLQGAHNKRSSIIIPKSCRQRARQLTRMGAAVWKQKATRGVPWLAWANAGSSSSSGTLLGGAPPSQATAQHIPDSVLILLRI